MKTLTLALVSGFLLPVLSSAGETDDPLGLSALYGPPRSKLEMEVTVGKVRSLLAGMEESLAKVILKGGDDEESRERKAFACSILGQIRSDSPAVIEALVKSLDKSFVNRHPGARRGGRMEPAEALARIGKPAVTSLIKVLSSDPDPRRRKSARICLTAIEGKRFAAILVRDAEGKHGTVATYVQEALEILERAE